jgi:membrane dipeptidase
MRLAPAVLLLALCAPTFAQDAALEHARRLLHDTVLVDGHNDLPWAIRTDARAHGDLSAYDLLGRAPGQTDFPRLAQGGLGAQLWSVYISADDPHPARAQLEQIDLARRLIERYPDRLALALRADDVAQARGSGRIASFLAMEGGVGLENSLAALRAFHALGVRAMTLTHSRNLDWADSSSGPDAHGGLTRFGEEVVREMNRLGMVVDLSHVSPGTMDDALRVSEAPVVFTHSSTRALCDHARNVPDDILKRLPANGGVVMVTFVNAFVSNEYAKIAKPVWAEADRRTRGVTDPQERERIHREVTKGVVYPKVTIGQVADHVEHVRRVAGVDHVGLGGDFDGNDSWPEGLEDVSKYPALFAELIRRGWSDADLRRLAGENFLRALRGVEAASKRLAARPPSMATIEQLDHPPAARAVAKPK